ncbi:MAG: protein kinase [Planctomycetaceae bacterium]|nr:protein kinase [Planctomycetaceae bacterium]
MKFPSAEFDDAVAATCHGVSSDDLIAELHLALRSDPEALDDYLWQVELHAQLASMACDRMRSEHKATKAILHPTNSPLSCGRHRNIIRWVSATVLLVIFCGVFLLRRIDSQPMAVDRDLQSDGLEQLPVVASSIVSDKIRDAGPVVAQAELTLKDGESGVKGLNAGFAGSAMGIYRENIRFAIAADAPVIVGMGKQNPIKLGARVPYLQGGDTLHVWDWSKSPLSRVMKETRLWVHDVFAVSPDGKQVVWADGKILDLTTGDQSQIDLGGQLYLDHTGGQLPRILNLQFAPDGKRLALMVSNVVLTPSTHPLRKLDFATAPTFQIVEFPSAKLVSEFPAGSPADLPLAISADGLRVVSQYSAGKSGQKLVERNLLTGEVRREYRPHIQDFAYALTFSPDGKCLAAFDGVGEVLIWDTMTGDLKHKLPRMSTTSSSTLRFSPDSKLLAFTLLPFTAKTVLFELETGATLAHDSESSYGDIHWSADGKSFDVISNVATRSLTEVEDSSGRLVLYSTYPAVRSWKVEDFRVK